MPVSNFLALPAVVHLATRVQPHRVLDIGIGMGTYGFMLRQFIDITGGALVKDEWKTVIDGIEIYEPYRNPIWDYYYDRVFVGDARVFLPGLERYDVVLCNDVLEHLELTEARAFMSRIVAEGQTLIATTPNVDYPQGPVFGNEAETHKCMLTRADFPELIMEIKTGQTTCFICSQRPDHISVLTREAFSNLKYNAPVLRMIAARLRNQVRRVLGTAH